MRTGDVSVVKQAQVTHAISANHPEACSAEEMPAEKKFSIHVVSGAAAKRSSSALATTASTCQIPGGRSLLVGCVLGKTLTVAHQQVRRTLERSPSAESEDFAVLPPCDSAPASEVPDGKERAGLLAVPRSMFISSPFVAIARKLSGTTMTLMFDKVVSPTDCRSTGHFVLPKRKVEEHFPLLSKPTGVWMTMLDESGKEWSFEFCFWHSKDSRIYYFKKFYPYVQATNLRGGDTVYFCRVEPKGDIFMGIRKQKLASSKNYVAAKSGASKDELEERTLSCRDARVSAEEGYSVLDEVAPQEDLPGTVSIYKASVDVDSERVIRKKKRRRTSPQSPLGQTKLVDHLEVGQALIEESPVGRRSVTPEALENVDIRPASVGSRGKRLEFTLEDYRGWEQIQDLLRAPPGSVATYADVEGCEFEEYQEPPVLIKKAFYSAEIERDDQWVKCDDCECWRKLPADAFIPARWICSDNKWDLERSYCNALQEMSDHDINRLLENVLDKEAETGSDRESCDDDLATPDSHLSKEDDDDGTRPKLALAETCKSYTIEKNSMPVGEVTPRLPGLRSLSRRPSALLSGQRLADVPSKAGKGHQMCTGCDKFIGSAAQACKRCGTLTEYGARRRAQSIGGYNQ